MFEHEIEGIRVRVEPQFLDDESEPEEHRFIWAYTIEIENNSDDTLQLVSRFWRITDANGVTQEVRGQGVVGQQPVISPGESFTYTSAAPLSAPFGVMQGSYGMMRLDDGEEIDIPVPTFALDCPFETPRVN